MKTSFQIPISAESKKLTQFLNKELRLFSKEFKDVSEADVRLKQDMEATSKNKICQVYLKLKSKNIFAVQKGKTFEEALHKTLVKLRLQVGNTVLLPENTIAGS